MPLHLASFDGSAEVVEYLVKKGAKISESNKDGVRLGERIQNPFFHQFKFSTSYKKFD